MTVSREELDTLLAIGRCFPLPRDYFIVDVETSGFSRDLDVIVAASWAFVQAGRVVAEENTIFDWTTWPGFDQGWLQSQLTRLADDFAKDGRVWHYPYARLATEGISPASAMAALATRLAGALAAGVPIVGHNVFGFDTGFIDAITYRFWGYELPWGDNSIYDTGLLEKAMVTQRVPWFAETRDEWQYRVYRAYCAQGQRWNLNPHCMTKYAVSERFGLDLTQTHTPTVDCRCCFGYMETLRQLIEVYRG